MLLQLSTSCCNLLVAQRPATGRFGEELEPQPHRSAPHWRQDYLHIDAVIYSCQWRINVVDICTLSLSRALPLC